MKYVECQKLTYPPCSRTEQYLSYCTIISDALILGSITMAYIIKAMHDIVFNMNIAGGDA